MWICIDMQRITLFHSFVQKILINLKIKESDWLRPFWLISREQDFSQIKNLCRNTTNNINFHVSYMIHQTKHYSRSSSIFLLMPCAFPHSWLPSVVEVCILDFNPTKHFTWMPYVSSVILHTTMLFTLP